MDEMNVTRHSHLRKFEGGLTNQTLNRIASWHALVLTHKDVNGGELNCTAVGL